MTMDPAYYFPYYFSNDVAEVLSLLFGFWMLSGLLSLASYVFGAIGLGTIANRRGIRNWALAWVPVLNVWILGSVADHYEREVNGREKKSRVLLLCLNLVTALFSLILVLQSLGTLLDMVMHPYYFSETDLFGFILSVLGLALFLWLLGIVTFIFTCIARYKLYQSCAPANAVLFLVLGLFFSFLNGFFYFAIRNRCDGLPRRQPVPGFVPQSQYYPPQQPPVQSQQPPVQPVQPVQPPVQPVQPPVEQAQTGEIMGADRPVPPADAPAPQPQQPQQPPQDGE